MGVGVWLCSRLGRVRYAGYNIFACCRTCWNCNRNGNRRGNYVADRLQLSLHDESVPWRGRYLLLRKKNFRIWSRLFKRVVFNFGLHCDNVGKCNRLANYFQKFFGRYFSIRISLQHCRLRSLFWRGVAVIECAVDFGRGLYSWRQSCGLRSNNRRLRTFWRRTDYFRRDCFKRRKYFWHSADFSAE